MPLTSDITIDASRFHPANVSEETVKINAALEQITVSGPKWHEVGIVSYREMREDGRTPLPPPIYLDQVKDATLPSREANREIPLRVYTPDNGEPSQGLLVHFHGGGFVLATHKHSDHLLQMYANKCQLTAISVGYRLAPEDPHPAGVEDCADAVTYLVDHGLAQYGCPLRFLAGESAGACLAALSTFHLLRSRPAHRLAGLILPYGSFDLSLALPSMIAAARPLMINYEAITRFADAYLPHKSDAERRHPGVSPLHEDLVALAAGCPQKSLPPALFLCGTADPVLDDTLLMGLKWMVVGEAVVKIYPGVPHGFNLLPGLSLGEEANDLCVQFVNEKMA